MFVCKKCILLLAITISACSLSADFICIKAISLVPTRGCCRLTQSLAAVVHKLSHHQSSWQNTFTFTDYWTTHFSQVRLYTDVHISVILQPQSFHVYICAAHITCSFFLLSTNKCDTKMRVCWGIMFSGLLREGNRLYSYHLSRVQSHPPNYTTYYLTLKEPESNTPHVHILFGNIKPN